MSMKVRTHGDDKRRSHDIEGYPHEHQETSLRAKGLL